MDKELNEFFVTKEMKDLLIARMTEELVFLRTKLGLSQDELSSLLGVSRQTYSTIETKRRIMSWGTYLSLVLIFDNNEQTHSILRNNGIFPSVIFGKSEVGIKEKQLSVISNLLMDDISGKLDEQAFHAIETVIMLEYARCNNMPGDAVIKAFDGKRFLRISEKDAEIQNVLASIKAGMDE